MSAVWYSAQLEARLVLALVFALSAAAKVRSPRAYGEFREAAVALGGPLVSRVITYGPSSLLAAVPAAEAALAVLLIAPATAAAALLGALALLLLFSLVLARAVRRGAQVACHCFGSSRAPVRGAQLLRNGLLMAMGCLGLAGAYADGAVRHPVPVLLVALVAAAALSWVVVLWDDLTELLAGPA
ncbi:MauE/DoxX family redox-associated membrane protein [Streptomyces sp. NPDC097595]|uniref:MauE/DoxX family redox-associated membrane protein n=1 Tax=Streptomyces sp. NPDC097595 TaxID=3366090 RepID=UPI0037FA1095